jgi:hypothetical protein
MNRGHGLILGAMALLCLPTLEAQAQYFYPYGTGYGGYGFDGWGATVYGDVARGMGAFAAGEGVYNYDTAVAASIDANTIMGINQYLYLSQQESNLREHELMARRQALVNKSAMTAQAIAARIRDNPTDADIDNGSALNAILDQLSEPRILNSSNLRMANAKIDSKLIRATPFRNATDAITITLDNLTDEKSWPLVLRDPKFDAERQAYIKAVDEALEEDKNGDISPATINKVRQAIANLYQRVADTIPRTRQPDHLQAMNYLKGLAGFSKMLERPNVEKVISELEKIETTTVGNLIAFMHSYNLRFGPAETPTQKEAYHQLYPIFVATRDKMIGRPVAPNAAPPPPAPGSATTPPSRPPTEIFHGMDPKYLHPTPGAVKPNTEPRDAAPKAPGSPR